MRRAALSIVGMALCAGFAAAPANAAPAGGARVNTKLTGVTTTKLTGVTTARSTGVTTTKLKGILVGQHRGILVSQRAGVTS